MGEGRNISFLSEGEETEEEAGGGRGPPRLDHEPASARLGAGEERPSGAPGPRGWGRRPPPVSTGGAAATRPEDIFSFYLSEPRSTSDQHRRLGIQWSIFTDVARLAAHRATRPREKSPIRSFLRPESGEQQTGTGWGALERRSRTRGRICTPAASTSARAGPSPARATSPYYLFPPRRPGSSTAAAGASAALLSTGTAGPGRRGPRRLGRTTRPAVSAPHSRTRLQDLLVHLSLLYFGSHCSGVSLEFPESQAVCSNSMVLCLWLWNRLCRME
jgi:hypothetical protein